MNVSKIELSSLVNSAHLFLKVFDSARKCLLIPLPKPKIEIESTKSKKISLLNTITISLNIRRDKNRLLFRFGDNNSCVFSIKKFELHGNQDILAETINLTHRETRHTNKNQYDVASKYEIFESNYEV